MDVQLNIAIWFIIAAYVVGVVLGLVIMRSVMEAKIQKMVTDFGNAMVITMNKATGKHRVFEYVASEDSFLGDDEPIIDSVLPALKGNAKRMLVESNNLWAFLGMTGMELAPHYRIAQYSIRLTLAPINGSKSLKYLNFYFNRIDKQKEV